MITPNEARCIEHSCAESTDTQDKWLCARALPVERGLGEIAHDPKRKHGQTDSDPGVSFEGEVKLALAHAPSDCIPAEPRGSSRKNDDEQNVVAHGSHYVSV